MQITDEIIESVSALAKLELSEPEKQQAKKDMADMLAYMEILNELDTEGIEPMSHMFPNDSIFRDDVLSNGDDRENMLKNAPLKAEGYYQVPKLFVKE